MSRPRILVFTLALTSLCALGVCPIASAATAPGTTPPPALAHTPTATTPGAWTRLSDRPGSPTDAPSVARDNTGVLHLIYTANAAVGNVALRTRDLSLAGRWGAPLTIVSGWRSIAAPDIDSQAGSTYAFWAGLEPAGTTPSGTGTAWAAQLSNGAWTKLLAPSTMSAGPADSTTLSAAVDRSGVPWFGWSTSGSSGLHMGFAAADPELVTPTTCCELGTNLQVDSGSGAIYEATRSTAPGTGGITLRQVTPTRGDAVVLKESSFNGSSVARSTRIATATRTTDGGVYVAYCAAVPKCTKLRVTNQTQRSLAVSLRVPARAESVAVAAGRDGHLWLTWTDIHQTVWAVRSNAAATRWGAPVHMVGPKGMTSAGHSAVDGSAGPLDLVLNATTGGSSWLWYTRMRPGLSITPIAPIMRGGGLQVVHITVSDAGDKVRTVVSFRGAQRTTTGDGVATIIIPPDTPPGRYPISASAVGYAGAASSVVVR